MARAIISFPVQADADAFCGQINTALGYPRAGRAVNGGTHAPAEMAVTDGYEAGRAADLSGWGVYNEPEVAVEIGARPPPALSRGTSRTVADSWFENRQVKPPKKPRPAGGGRP